MLMHLLLELIFNTEVATIVVVAMGMEAMVVAMVVMVHTTDGEILNLLLANHKKLLVWFLILFLH